MGLEHRCTYTHLHVDHFKMKIKLSSQFLVTTAALKSSAFQYTFNNLKPRMSILALHLRINTHGSALDSKVYPQPLWATDLALLIPPALPELNILPSR
ncbi:hypothetical protein PM082_006656 [Marasmius tenuissimus]|nr:hypothetical protein PM082_006656 [Marasmius tenuissimus]